MASSCVCILVRRSSICFYFNRAGCVFIFLKVPMTRSTRRNLVLLLITSGVILGEIFLRLAIFSGRFFHSLPGQFRLVCWKSHQVDPAGNISVTKSPAGFSTDDLARWLSSVQIIQKHLWWKTRADATRDLSRA